MTRNGLKLLEIAGNFWKGWKWLDMARNGWNDWKWLNNGWKLIEMVGIT